MLSWSRILNRQISELPTSKVPHATSFAENTEKHEVERANRDSQSCADSSVSTSELLQLFYGSSSSFLAANRQTLVHFNPNVVVFG